MNNAASNNAPAKPRNNSADRAVVIGRVSRKMIRDMDATVARNREIEKAAREARAIR